MPLWAGALAAVAALLLAAKAHGRQVRLEREAAGFHEVVFGGTNPPFVEALWRRDRIRFWSLVPPLALVLGGALLWARGWAHALVAALLWAPIAGFHAAGLWSYAAQRGRGGPWWWSASFVASAAAVALALV